MYVRLAFAVAAHLEPEILLVDEVLAVGDAEFQKKCLGKMQTVVREGRTVLFVSHNMAAIKSLCQRAILLRRRARRRGRPGRRRRRSLPVDRPRPPPMTARFPDRAANGHRRGARCVAPSSPTRVIAVGVAGVSSASPSACDMTFEVTQPIRDAIVSVGVSSLDGDADRDGL